MINVLSEFPAGGAPMSSASTASPIRCDPPSDALVTVVIPTFNRAHCVGRAIASVVDQTYPHLEIIVVDDGSTDDTRSMLDSFGGERPLRVVRLARNAGAPTARNEGIRVACGVYVAFLDSDDTWYPHKIERQLATLRRQGSACGAGYTLLEYLDQDERPSWVTRAVEVGDQRAALMTYNFVGSTSSILARRELLVAAGGFTPSLRSCQDWDLWCRLAEMTTFACTAEVLTTIR